MTVLSFREQKNYFAALKLIIQQMKTESLILPQLHNAKLAAYVAYKEVISKVTKEEQQQIHELSREIDFNTLERILSMFGPY